VGAAEEDRKSLVFTAAIEVHVSDVSEDGEQLCDVMEQHIGQVVDTQHLFTSFTLDSFSEIAFGHPLDCLHKQVKFATAFSEATRCIERRFIVPLSKHLAFLPHERSLRRSLKVIDEFAYDVIAKRKAERKVDHNHRNDLLSMFIDYKNEDGALQYTDVELRDHILNFVVAGRDTTAQTLTWLFYELSRNPQVEAKLREEVNRLFSSQRPDYDSVKHTPYLKAVIDETLRLWPPVPGDFKHALKDDVLPSGTKVPGGVNIVWCQWVMSRIPLYWDDPLVFRPERWLGDSKIAPPNGNHPPFIPFQYGPRTCLGLQMAYLEVKLITVMIMQRFSMRHDPNHQVAILRAVTLGAKYGMNMILEKRK